MSVGRSGYTDDWPDDNAGWLWRGAVRSAIRGRRGQAFLRELRAALDAMPVKRLIEGELEQDGEVCAIGAVGRARGMDMSKIYVDDRDVVAAAFGIAPALVAELEFYNDDDFGGYDCERTPEKRWEVVSRWVDRQLRGDHDE